jgi:hypothetical protein
VGHGLDGYLEAMDWIKEQNAAKGASNGRKIESDS